jgi:hypothetical protein
VAIRLYTFGHDGQLELPGQVDAVFDDRQGRRVGDRVFDELPVDLQLVERQVSQLFERRVAGPKVVNREAETLEAQARGGVEQDRRVG